MIRELVLVRVAVRTGHIEAVVPDVGQRRVVAVVDRPVQPGENLLVFVRQAEHLVARVEVVAIGATRDFADPVELGLRYADYRPAALLIARTAVEQVRSFPLLVRGEEK